MAVGIQRQRHSAVAEPLAGDLGMHPCKQGGGVTMPEIILFLTLPAALRCRALALAPIAQDAQPAADWTPNGHLAPIIGVGLAYRLTLLIGAIPPLTYGRPTRLPRQRAPE